jgi:hypothetical protein
MKQIKRTCNKCGKQLSRLSISVSLLQLNYLCFCDNPKCNRYGLFQIPKEQMKQIMILKK